MIKQFNKEYSWLSNFAPCKIIIGDLEFSSIEHAYMSEKSNDRDWKEICADKSNSPANIKKVSKMVDLRKDWEDIKLSVMEKCIDQKFSQEPYETLLLATKNEMIQEGNWWGDTFWGIDLKTEKGKNNLGKLIMEKRKKLKYG